MEIKQIEARLKAEAKQDVLVGSGPKPKKDGEYL